MSRLTSYIALTRPVNCLIAAASIFLGAFVTGTIDPFWRICIASLSGSFIAAGGNAVNDYCDIDIDRINRPLRPIPSGKISRHQALILGTVLLAVGAILGWTLGWKTGLIASASSVILILYSKYLKGMVLVGNISVGLIASLAFLYGGLAFGRFRSTLIPAWFAFLFHLGREIIKDVEDMEGDRAGHAQTLPIRYGERTSLAIASIVFVLLIISTLIPFFLRIYGAVYLWVVVFGVDCPLMYVIASVWHDSHPAHLGRLSFLLKLDMLVGLLAIYLGSRF